MIERGLLGRLKKLLAPPRGVRVEPEDAVDEGIRLAGQTVGRANLRDKTSLQRELGRDGIAEEHEWKCEARQGVFAEVGHDRGGSEAGTHFRKAEGCVMSYESEIRHDRESESEAKSI